MDTKIEFDRQIATLLEKNYPKLAGITEHEFIKKLEPLKSIIDRLPSFDVDLEAGRLPFCIVIKSNLVPTDKSMTCVQKNGVTGVIKLYPHTPIDFTDIDEISVPSDLAYLLVDIDRGKNSINLVPRDALNMINNANRSPLTIDEGIAIITHFPDFLMKNNCFSLLASRHLSDKRVPAIWIDAEKRPHLGWCWEGNPHTWLGSASCKSRIN